LRRRFSDSTVDRPPADRFWFHRDDAALAYGIRRFRDTNVDVMAKTIGGIDNEIMAVIELVGQARSTTVHDLARGRGFWIVNRIVAEAAANAFPQAHGAWS